MSTRYLIWGLAFSVGLNLVMLGTVGYHLIEGVWTPARASMAPSSPITHALQFDEKRLKLTPEQHESFQEIRERWTKGEQKAKREGEQRIKRLSALLVRDDMTTETLQPIFQEFSRHSDNFFVRLSGALQEYRAQLKPEQRAIFNTMLRERFDMLQRFVNRKNFEYEQRMTTMMMQQRKKGNKGGEKKPGDKKFEKKNNRPEKQANKPAAQRQENRRKDDKPAKGQDKQAGQAGQTGQVKQGQDAAKANGREGKPQKQDK
jgi:hypothetical protein